MITQINIKIIFYTFIVTILLAALFFIWDLNNKKKELEQELIKSSLKLQLEKSNNSTLKSAIEKQNEELEKLKVDKEKKEDEFKNWKKKTKEEKYQNLKKLELKSNEYKDIKSYLDDIRNLNF